MSSDESRDQGCSAPPAPGGLALVAAADGEADEATREHLQSCPHCAARVAQIRRLQARLLRRLYRLHCPSSGVLVDYCQGLLDPFQRAAVSHHLALCPHCAAELNLLQRAELMADAIGMGPRGRVGVSLA